MKFNKASLIGQFGIRLAAGLGLLFLTAPLLIVIPLSFTTSRFLTFPPPGLSLQWYERIFQSFDWSSAAIASLQVGVGTAFGAAVIGTMAALGLRHNFPGRAIVRAFLLSPLLMPAIVLAIAYYVQYSALNRAGVPMLDSRFGLIIAHITITVPFVIVTVTASLASFDDTLIRAAKSLGASETQTFRKVTFPLIRPGVFSGALFAFLTSFDELIISLFLSGGTVRTLPIRMWDGIRFEVEPTLAAAATLLILVSFAVLTTAELLKRNRD